MAKKKEVKSYPRVYVSASTHKRVAALAKKEGKSMKEIGNRLVLAGLKASK